jgi:hypothetical protein
MNVFLSIFACVLFDFWVTKNISGRCMVGLRWWTFVDDDGEPEYCFESFDYEVKTSRIDKTIFWWGLSSNTIFWSIMMAINVFGLDFLYVG